MVDEETSQEREYCLLIKLKCLKESSLAHLTVIKALSVDHRPIFIADILERLPNPHLLKILGVRTLIGPDVQGHNCRDLRYLTKFTGLQEAHLKLVFHFVNTPSFMRTWLSRSVTKVLQETLFCLKELRTVSIECPYLETNWQLFSPDQKSTVLKNIPHICNLDLDTGLQTGSESGLKYLIPLTSLETLIYSYYGDFLHLHELDTVEYLLERNRNLRYICLKIPHEVLNRLSFVKNGFEMAQNWQPITFYFASYWNEYFEENSVLTCQKLSENVFFDAYPDEVSELHEYFGKVTEIDNETRVKLLHRSLADRPSFVPSRNCYATPPPSSTIAMW